MTSADWNPDSNADTHGLTAPDLFGGELFGDELMDMYNSAADVANEMIDNEIPALLGSSTAPGAATKTKVEAGAHLTIASDGIGDGLGAFRPSTSFNDLSSLMPPVTGSGAETRTAVMPAVTGAPVPVPKPAPKKATGRKRAAANGSAGPPKKRGGGRGRASPATTAARRGAASKAGKAAAGRAPTARAGPPSAGQAALKLRKEQRALIAGVPLKGSNNTPNPLSNVAGVKVAPLPKVGAKVKPLPVPSAGPNPAVVTPKLGGPGKGDSITSEAAAATAAAAAVAAAAAAAVTAPAPKPPRGQTTEADFKSVAQAAVTNLILNAGASSLKDGKSAQETFSGKVDTSTSHIKALTSSNWVNACGGGDADNAANAASAADAKANNRARRQNLTPDERARQNRDRNREHARNTRLRKKAYVEELKRTLTELVAQRDAVELEKRHAAQREMEQREVRFRVMEEFLKLRGRSESNLARWVAILEDNFTLTLPKTDYRKMVGNEPVRPGTATDQVLRGASEVMTDASHLSTFLRTIGKESASQTKSNASIQHHCERKKFFMDGSSAVLDWSATAIGDPAVKLSFKGLMRARFSPASNKLISAELIFDSGHVASQVVNLVVNTSTATDEVAAAAAAAQAAANEAESLLDSLEMPHLNAVPAAITVLPQSKATSGAVSVTSSEKEETSSDESIAEHAEVTRGAFGKRRSARVRE